MPRRPDEASGYSTLPRSRPCRTALSSRAELVPRARVDGGSESESENAEARTCASSSPSPCGTELARIPSRCPCSCLTAAAWPNVDARHQSCGGLARALELLFAPLPDPVHLLRIAVKRAACAEGRGQGHGSWAEVMAHGPRRLQHGAHCTGRRRRGCDSMATGRSSFRPSARDRRVRRISRPYDSFALLFCASPSSSP